MEKAAAQILLRNFTETKRIDRRLYAIGDWVLPAAIPYRGLGIFIILAVPLWLIYSASGLQVEMDNLWIWLSPPILGAAMGYAVRIQGKSMTAVITANVSFGWWWLRHRNDSRTRTIRLLCVLWRPEHRAYKIQAAKAADRSDAGPASRMELLIEGARSCL